MRNFLLQWRPVEADCDRINLEQSWVADSKRSTHAGNKSLSQWIRRGSVVELAVTRDYHVGWHEECWAFESGSHLRVNSCWDETVSSIPRTVLESCSMVKSTAHMSLVCSFSLVFFCYNRKRRKVPNEWSQLQWSKADVTFWSDANAHETHVKHSIIRWQKLTTAVHCQIIEVLL